MLATAPVVPHDPSDRGAQGLAVEAPAVRPATAGSRAADRVLGAAPAPLEAGLRMLGTAASDVAGALGGSWPTDPLSERDPDYIRETLPALRLLSSCYFRADVRGLENIPATGPVLLVGNHSGGVMIADTFVFAQAFYDQFGPERRFHQLADDLVFKVPGTRALVQRFGAIPASPEHMRRALDRDAALLVYPGGDHETYRPSWWRSRDLPALLGVGRDRVRGADRVHRARAGARRPGRPGGRPRRPGDRAVPWSRPAAGERPPAGPTAAPEGPSACDRAPVRSHRARPARAHPAAVQDHHPRARPIDLRARLGPDPDRHDAYRLVTDTMQESLSALSRKRRFPVIG
jgi:hypothetical protein